MKERKENPVNVTGLVRQHLPASPPHPACTVFSCSWGTDVCMAVSLSHWSQRASCSTNTHTHCGACGVSSAATAFCVSVCVCLCVCGLQYRVKTAVSVPPLPTPSLCKHSTSAVITGEPAEALSPVPASKLSPSNPALSCMVDTHLCT